MNKFDHLGEDLTSMMFELDAYPDQDRVRRLIRALTKAHEEACVASQMLRQDLSEERLRRQAEILAA
jgi:hypothetical protein